MSADEMATIEPSDVSRSPGAGRGTLDQQEAVRAAGGTRRNAMIAVTVPAAQTATATAAANGRLLTLLFQRVDFIASLYVGEARTGVPRFAAGPSRARRLA